MDDTDSQRAPPGDPAPDETATNGHGEASPDRMAEDLREQIAALRQQVKDAQDILRDHHRRQEGRSFKG